MTETRLNAAAAAYVPSTQQQAHGAARNGDGNERSGEARRSRPRNRKKKTDITTNTTSMAQNGVDSVATGGNAPSLVPASVRRRRQSPSDKPMTPTKSKTKTQSKATTPPADDVDYCLLCADPIQFYAVGECNHHGICSKCSMRMRSLMDDRNCPICKQYIDRVIVSATERSFESFQLWGDAGGLDSVLDEASEIIFYECRAHYNELRRLNEYGCRMTRCKVICGSLPKLKDHMRIEHGTEFCELCMQHQHFFVQEHQVFTKNGLRMHCIGTNRATGPRSSGKDFHPMCQFCKRRFYGDMQLYEHLERDHFRCHLCKNEHEYFRNYSSLEAHFRREHFLCEEPACRENHFVVFGNDIEYHAHMRAIHGVVNRLTLNFQVARTGENPLDGGAAVDGVPESWSYETAEVVNPRTQLENAFPALPTSSAPAPPPVSQPAIPPRSLARVSSGSSSSAAFTARGAAPSAPPQAQILRNQRLAEALGLARPGQSVEAFELEMKTPKYPQQLVDWAKVNLSYLQVVERRLERIVQDPTCHSVSLRPMPSEERALLHQLASLYGVASQSFGEDPFRRISFYKADDAFVPEVTLSAFVKGTMKAPTRAGSAASRLSFLPLRGGSAQGAQPSEPRGAPAASAPPVAAPVNRGWEKIEPKRKPVVKDAWSDDDEDDGHVGQAVDR